MNKYSSLQLLNMSLSYQMNIIDFISMNLITISSIKKYMPFGFPYKQNEIKRCLNNAYKYIENLYPLIIVDLSNSTKDSKDIFTSLDLNCSLLPKQIKLLIKDCITLHHNNIYSLSSLHYEGIYNDSEYFSLLTKQIIDDFLLLEVCQQFTYSMSIDIMNYGIDSYIYNKRQIPFSELEKIKHFDEKEKTNYLLNLLDYQDDDDNPFYNNATIKNDFHHELKSFIQNILSYNDKKEKHNAK